MGLSKVNPGDPISATDWNAIVEALGVRTAPSGKRGRSFQLPKNTVVVDVMNVSGETLPRFSAVTVKNVAAVPDEGDDDAEVTYEFTQRTILKVGKPESSNEGRFFVTLEGLEDDQVGKAVALGVTPCRINLGATQDTTVDIEDANIIPQSSEAGSAQILWVKGGVGSADSTGEQWAVIRIGGGAGAELPQPQYQFQVLQAVSQNQIGADWVRGHDLV